MISFTCDYSEGAHPAILQRLVNTNLVQQPGYGADDYTHSAIERIRQATDCPEAAVFLLVGGTQTNATVIDAMLTACDGVVACDSGHIAVHEAGAVEHSGHKVITLPADDGKLPAATLADYLRAFRADDSRDHMVQPAMVYVSMSTELGTIYSRAELEALHAVCREYGLSLFVDGARLGYALACPECDLTLPQLARLCDVFYIGGTKVGALCGEAVVFPRGNAPRQFFSVVKQHGALMAKGRLLGVQFDTLMADGLYLRIAAHAIEQARRLRQTMEQKGIAFFNDSPTNQQFPLLTAEQMERLDGKVRFEVWQPMPDGRFLTRFATSWATPPEHIDRLASLL